MREDRIPRSSRVRPRDGTGNPGTPSPGVSDRQPEVHVSAWLQPSEEDHVGLTHGVVSSTWKSLHANVQTTHLTCIGISIAKLQELKHVRAYKL